MRCYLRGSFATAQVPSPLLSCWSRRRWNLVILCWLHSSYNISAKDRFHIPILDELVDELHSSFVFSKLDLQSGYHHILMHEQDIPKPLFGHMRVTKNFLSCPSSLPTPNNSSINHEPIISTLFMLICCSFPHRYFNLVLLWLYISITYLRFSFLVNESFYLRYSKCLFAQDHIEYLGHVISSKGIAPDLTKIEAMLHWPVPTNLKELGGFLRFTSYYKRFIKDYAAIAFHLTKFQKRMHFAGQWAPSWLFKI